MASRRHVGFRANQPQGPSRGVRHLRDRRSVIGEAADSDVERFLAHHLGTDTVQVGLSRIAEAAPHMSLSSRASFDRLTMMARDPGQLLGSLAALDMTVSLCSDL